ncbi:hypothetical protein DY000_02020544 [Brassica cretica]|uniref:Uncharacterized protein n=1 Tax=Brassica cretica TaxID=69181 RepID=A0ABQ7EJC6_BRACR|nr:hypothetical protein DY000_02020544 [Brassica cretica]
MARITHFPHRHAATRSRVASPITRVFASCPKLILVRPRTRNGPRVDTNDSHDTPPECRTLTDQVRGFTGFPVVHGKQEVSLPPKPTNRRQLGVLATRTAWRWSSQGEAHVQLPEGEGYYTKEQAFRLGCLQAVLGVPSAPLRGCVAYTPAFRTARYDMDHSVMSRWRDRSSFSGLTRCLLA